jgi:lysophospholipase L1-like esterase
MSEFPEPFPSASSPSPSAPETGTAFFRPWTLLAGFVLGLVLLAWAGRAVVRQDLHPKSVRFHPMIAPDSQYEPTVGEMQAFVRARCRSDQVLVIVGGNSILLGVGQPADKVWTRRLQELLGDRYAVVNLAFRGSSPTDGGAFVAESLRNEFPNQIYIANVAPFQAADAIGIESYRFIFFDAYYKHLLLPWAPREEELRAYLADRPTHRERLERRLGAQADAWLHFRDYWNWWSSTKFFTFGTPFQPDAKLAFKPRNYFSDEENDYEGTPFDQRFYPAAVANDTIIARAYSAVGYTKNASGNWELIPSVYEGFRKVAQRAFPDPVKPRTLILISRNSPFYTRQLAPDLQARDELAIRDTIAGWESLGYSSMDYGRDFTPEDFGDRTHLTSTGGGKLAEAVAPKVQSLAARLGYLKP